MTKRKKNKKFRMSLHDFLGKMADATGWDGWEIGDDNDGQFIIYTNLKYDTDIDFITEFEENDR